MSGFSFRVAKGGLQLGRVQGFLVFGGFFGLGYCLGLVTVVQSLGFLRVKSGFTFWVCQGGLRLGRVQGFLGYRGFLRQVYCLGLVTVVQGLGLLKVQSGFVLRVIQGYLGFFTVEQGCLGFLVFRGFLRFGYCLGLVTVVQGLGIGLRFRVVSRFGLFTVGQGLGF